MKRSLLLAGCWIAFVGLGCDGDSGGGEPDARDTVEIVDTVVDEGGEIDPCRLSGGHDYSDTLATDAQFRTFCADRCYAECYLLVDCGRYAAGGDGWAQCVTDCTGPTARNCTTMTAEAMCPAATYPDSPSITENEAEACLQDARFAACWCDAGANCWASPPPTEPIGCTTDCLCDTR